MLLTGFDCLLLLVLVGNKMCYKLIWVLAEAFLLLLYIFISNHVHEIHLSPKNPNLNLPIIRFFKDFPDLSY